MTAYYNEIDPFAAQWLRNLIAGGHIAPGEVDERSIEDVTPDDLRGFTQCHFFSGIGVWSHSLRLAGWPDDKPVWTGSCPCQPFSAAGKGDGFADVRHLWPAFFHLISECRPEHLLGEQVASGNSNEWFDLVQADLEGMDYAFGLTPFPSSGIGAPHIRERAYWVAHASCEHESAAGDKAGIAARIWGGQVDGLADAGSERFNGIDALLQREESGWIAKDMPEAPRHSNSGSMAYANSERLQGQWENGNQERWERSDVRQAGLCGGARSNRPLEVNGFWRDADWLFCRDGKWRPVEPVTFPLVARFAKSLGHGKSSLRAMAGRNRTGRLKGYGNAINAQAAASFIGAYMETTNVPANPAGPDIR
ncbi:DNA cytosine methyltransferase [Enterobacter kobei]|uniref:DNA cytosine methyltransferase n=1 Tax=Enterobacter kobei TaxID=208224 RepID=UPI0011EF097D|nr:DNA cytosine methyltransferase [Enterobacter kobei]ELQ3772978.1 DNA cytosine methyltransferase [Enterobacter kobei]QEO02545.1 DNA cytosine methyltransferase [Enterobacter kobei]